MAADRGIGLSCFLEVEVVQRVKLVYICVSGYCLGKMASRRSRLQVKPNIGGPKAKAPPKLKIPDQGSKKLDCKYSTKNPDYSEYLETILC